MLTQSPERTLSWKLRHDAETRLKESAAPATIGWVVGANALSLLYELASNPASRAARSGLAIPANKAWPALDERTRHGCLAPSSASA